MKNISILVVLMVLFSQCSGESLYVNEKTSEIHYLSTRCLENDAWSKIIDRFGYSDSLVDNVELRVAAEKIENKPFESDILYFEDCQELVAISSDRYSIRYIYNQKISDQIIDGFSSDLTRRDKKRIAEKVIKIVMEYQCDVGKNESQKIIDEIQGN